MTHNSVRVRRSELYHTKGNYGTMTQLLPSAICRRLYHTKGNYGTMTSMRITVLYRELYHTKGNYGTMTSEFNYSKSKYAFQEIIYFS